MIISDNQEEEVEFNADLILANIALRNENYNEFKQINSGLIDLSRKKELLQKVE